MGIVRAIWDWLGSDRHGLRRFKLEGWHFFAAYVLIGVYTFGYNASNYPHCDKDYSISSNEPDTSEREPARTAIKAGAAGTAWPLYWTWELMDTTEEGPKC